MLRPLGFERGGRLKLHETGALDGGVAGENIVVVAGNNIEARVQKEGADGHPERVILRPRAIQYAQIAVTREVVLSLSKSRGAGP